MHLQLKDYLRSKILPNTNLWSENKIAIIKRKVGLALSQISLQSCHINSLWDKWESYSPASVSVSHVTSLFFAKNFLTTVTETVTHFWLYSVCWIRATSLFCFKWECLCLHSNTCSNSSPALVKVVNLSVTTESEVHSRKKQMENTNKESECFLLPAEKLKHYTPEHFLRMEITTLTFYILMHTVFHPRFSFFGVIPPAEVIRPDTSTHATVLQISRCPAAPR